MFRVGRRDLQAFRDGEDEEMEEGEVADPSLDPDR